MDLCTIIEQVWNTLNVYTEALLEMKKARQNALVTNDKQC